MSKPIKQGAASSRKTTLRYSELACAALLFTLVVDRSAANDRRQQDPDVWFVHATDPHIFIPPKKTGREKQQNLNRKALADMLKCVGSMPKSDRQPAFLVLTGDLGVDPCDISNAESQAGRATPPRQGQAQRTAEAQNEARENEKAFSPAKACLETVDQDARMQQIEITAELLGQSPVLDIYLIAGNNDIAKEVADDAALQYFNKFIDEVQAKLAERKRNVHLHNLTRCYATGEDPAACYADIARTRYRLVGYPSYSFKNSEKEAGDNTSAQTKQLEVFQRLLGDSRQAGKRVLIISHTPEIDDPFTLAQDLYAGQAPAPARDKDPKNPRSVWSTWNVTTKIQEDWKNVVASDSVLGVLAGHLHDSHKEIYRRPYAWSTVNDYRGTFDKLFLAPPLAVKNQDKSPIQARGFLLMHLQAAHAQSRLFWYNSKTGEFVSDRGTDSCRHKRRSFWSCTVLTRLWSLDTTDAALVRMATLLIAFLTAFLTVVAVWQIPPASDPFADDKKAAQGELKSTQSGSTAPADSSPFSSKFGKTVIAGVGGLVAAEVAKALGNQQPSADTRWYYIVWFIVFFFFLLIGLNFWRALVEALRSRSAIIYYPLRRRPEMPPAHLGGQGRQASAQRFWRWLAYQITRILHWLKSWLGVPLLTFSDTFVNLIQGKNQTITRAFSDKIVDQQCNVVRVAKAIRQQLNDVIVERLRIAKSPRQVRPGDVRVNISVLSADLSHVFYIAWASGSVMKVFSKRSVAWVSVFTGRIRWYKRSYSSDEDLFKGIVLFDNSAQKIPDGEPEIHLSSHYQPRSGEDYEAFVMFPVPHPQRGDTSEYIRGAIHISFRQQDHFDWIWPPQGDAVKMEEAIQDAKTINIAINNAQAAEEIKRLKLDKQTKIDLARQFARHLYDSDELMLDTWCKDDQVRATLNDAVVILGELLRGFNENIYKVSDEPVPMT